MVGEPGFDFFDIGEIRLKNDELGLLVGWVGFVVDVFQAIFHKYIVQHWL